MKMTARSFTIIMADAAMLYLYGSVGNSAKRYGILLPK